MENLDKSRELDNSAFISLDDAMDEEKNTGASFYVVNNSINVRPNPTDVVFSIPGEANAIVVPHTFIPINIGLQINKKQIITSNDFLKALNNRLLRVVNTADAERYLAYNEDARLEADRLFKISMERGRVIDDEEQKKPEVVVADGNNVRIAIRNIIEDNTISNEDKRLRIRPFNPTDAEKAWIATKVNL